ncbi:MAG: hypothetical protein ACETVX_04020, partial [bacterium]
TFNKGKTLVPTSLDPKLIINNRMFSIMISPTFLLYFTQILYKVKRFAELTTEKAELNLTTKARNHKIVKVSTSQSSFWLGYGILLFN